MTQEKYNYITKPKLNRIRERIERFCYMELNEFIDLILRSINRLPCIIYQHINNKLT